MYFERIPIQNSITEGLEFDPMLGNKIQKDLIIEMSPDDPMGFINKHAERFRELFEAHPEWRKMYLDDREGTLKIIKDILDSTVH